MGKPKPLEDRDYKHTRMVPMDILDGAYVRAVTTPVLGRQGHYEPDTIHGRNCYRGEVEGERCRKEHLVCITTNEPSFHASRMIIV